MTQMKHDRSLPEVLAEDLRARILGGEFRPGDRLPTEHQLVEQTGLSRPTVRAAMRILISSGLIRVRQGKGAFIRRRGPGITTGLQELRSTRGLILSQRGDCEIRYSRVERRAATPAEATRFEVDGDLEIVAIERCFVSLGEVICYEWALLNAELLPAGSDPSSDNGSVFDFLEPHGLRPAEAIATLHASQRDIEWDGERTGTNLYVCLTQQAFLKNGDVISVSDSYFLDGSFEFMVYRS